MENTLDSRTQMNADKLYYDTLYLSSSVLYYEHTEGWTYCIKYKINRKTSGKKWCAKYMEE